ncbi:MAG: ATP phosphoribosyltransferase regulatory subunit [Candidatus Doudnabacteria bacterium]|nr:ATP phosphoribosyltransferase regulatory subunit [Candidatus Doudnabacteria bacterium]
MGRPKKLTPTVEKAPPRLAGAVDLLPEQHLSLDMFLEKLTDLAHNFSYAKVDTPILEDASLFSFWSQGADQLISFNDAKNNLVALKPTNIFSLARAYLEHHFPERERVSKWYYHSPVAWLTSSGETKQTSEFGFQIFGATAPIADSQMVNLLLKLFREIGLPNLSLEINNTGCIECLPNYQEQLKVYFKDKKYDLCEDCLENLENNQPLQILACTNLSLENNQPLQILACTNLSCSTVASEAPAIIDYLCENCRRHFIGVLEGLDELGLVYNLNPKVIGKPWSRKTVFEIRCRTESGEVTLGYGGHADDLIQGLGGLPAQALGFVGTLDKILAAFEAANVKFTTKNKVDVFLVPLGDLAAKKTLRLFTELWNHNIVASEFSGPGSIKTQLKLAESNKVSIALIIGQKEAREGTVILRDVRSGMQELFTYERIIEEVKKRLGK